MRDRLYIYNHSPIEFYFKQNPENFVVKEVPLYEFSGEGEHLVLYIRKKNLSTFELVKKIAKHLNIKEKEIGYAGLKDKNALTYQYISVHKKYEKELNNLDIEGVKILDATYHQNKIRIGHLKGNSFFVRLKKVDSVNAKKIDEVLKNIKNYGMPNFFGYQRFGRDKNNFKDGKDILDGIKKERNPKLKRFLVNSYQSHLFNLWLSKRVEISRLIEEFSLNELVDLVNIPKDELKQIKSQTHPFKLLYGDIMQHYPYGKLFEFEYDEYERFLKRDISITGLLSGKKTKKAINLARIYEKDFDEELNLAGSRRFAWVFAEDIEGTYKEIEAWYELNFYLPKGSYATVLLEEISKRDIS